MSQINANKKVNYRDSNKKEEDTWTKLKNLLTYKDYKTI